MATNQPALIAFSILLALFAAPTAMAQSVVWSVRLDEPEPAVDRGRGLTRDPSGNTYVCGVNDIGWVVWKIAPDGALLWTWNEGIPRSSIYWGNQIGALTDGSVVVAGAADGGFTIVRLSSVGERLSMTTHDRWPELEAIIAFSPDGHVAHLVSRTEPIELRLFEPDGDLAWERYYAANTGPTLSANALVFAPDNSLLLGVSVPREADQNPTRIVIARFDVGGEVVSEFVVPGEFNDKVRALATDASGRIAVVGTRKFPDLLTTALATLFSSDGSVLWANTVSLDDARREYRLVAIDATSGAVLAGGVSMPPNETPNELVLSRFELDGSEAWTAATGPGEADSTIHAVAFDANGTAHVVGNWTNTSTLPIVVRSYLPNGQSVRDVSYSSGSLNGDRLTAALVTPDGSVVALAPNALDAAATSIAPNTDVAWRAVLGSELGTEDVLPTAAPDGIGGLFVTANDPQGIQARLARIDANGNLLWFTPIHDLRMVARLATDPLGNAVICGFVRGVDAFSEPAVVRVSPSGELLSTTRCPPAQRGSDIFTGFAVDAVGNAYVTIVSEQDAPPVVSPFPRRYLKISPGGAIVFSVERRGAHIVPDLDGSSFTVGTDQTNPDFWHARLTRYGAQGSVVWQRLIDDLAFETVASAAQLGSDGNLYVLGYALGGTGRELLATSYTRTGERRWLTTYGADWNQRPIATEFALDEHNTMVIAVSAYANEGSNSGPQNAGLLVVNSDGSVRSAALFEGLIGDEKPHGVTVDSSGWVYLFGGAGGYYPSSPFLTRCDLDCVPYWSTRVAQPDFISSFNTILPTDDGGIFVVGHDSTRLTRSDVAINRLSEPPTCDANARCQGDTDGDCAVSMADLAVVLGQFGTYPALREAPANGDADIDGAVSLTDLALVLQNFGTNCD